MIRSKNVFCKQNSFFKISLRSFDEKFHMHKQNEQGVNEKKIQKKCHFADSKHLVFLTTNWCRHGPLPVYFLKQKQVSPEDWACHFRNRIFN